MALAPEDINDLVNSTLESVYKQGKWTDLSQTKQHKTISDRFFKGDKMQLASGPTLTFPVQTAAHSNTRYSGLYDDDTFGHGNAVKRGSINFSTVTNNYEFDVNEPEFLSDNPKVVVDYIDMRIHGAIEGWFDFLEDKFWTAPASPNVGADALTPLMGVPLWLQKSATTGFNGGDPSGWAAGAGNILTTDVSGWKNYTFTFGGINRDDFVAKARTALAFCKFMPAHSYAQANSDPRYVLYTTKVVEEGCAKYLDNRNDNIGKDMSGISAPMFQGYPIVWVPALTHSDQVAYDSTNPVYGVNWNSFKMAYTKALQMSPVEKKAGQHNVRVGFMDMNLQLFCNDRRSNFVAYQTAS